MDRWRDDIARIDETRALFVAEAAQHSCYVINGKVTSVDAWVVTDSGQMRDTAAQHSYQNIQKLNSTAQQNIL